MQAILNITLHSLQNDLRRLEIISMNLANTQTVGYQREIALNSPMMSSLSSPASSPVSSSVSSTFNTAFADLLNPESAFTSTVTSVRDRHPGALKASGQNLDLALNGEGFFEVATASGPAYTRDGHFHLDTTGRLVSAAGNPVMGSEGEIVLPSDQVSIDATGQIRARDNPTQAPLARLRLVHFDDPSSMQVLGAGLLSAGSTSASASARVDDKASTLQQGTLENANVNPMQEMLQLMHTMRHAEAMQKLVQGYDDMLGNAIRQLGKD